MAGQYSWIKMPLTFFEQKKMKKLRKIAGGDTYALIYLKMLMSAADQDGKLFFEGVEESFAEELALDLDEELEDIKVTVQYLLAQGLLTQDSEWEYTLTEYRTLTGAENSSTARVRAFRERKLLQNERETACNSDETECNVTCNADETECNVTCNSGETECNTKNKSKNKSKSREDKEKDKDRDREKEGEGGGTAASVETVCQTQSVRPAIDRIVEEWNTLSSYGIPSVSQITSGSKRYKSLVARLNQFSEPQIFDAIQKIRESEFLQGHNPRGWTITFDWFVLPANFPKILEGNYDKKEAAKEDNLSGIKDWYSKHRGLDEYSSSTSNNVPTDWFSGNK